VAKLNTAGKISLAAAAIEPLP